MSGIFHSGGYRKILDEAEAELERQNEVWGEQNHPDGTGEPGDRLFADMARRDADTAHENGALTWRHILTEEFFEAVAEEDGDNLREELIQVAAVALQWVSAIDRR